jgi:hypothetical protein
MLSPGQSQRERQITLDDIRYKENYNMSYKFVMRIVPLDLKIISTIKEYRTFSGAYPSRKLNQIKIGRVE